MFSAWDIVRPRPWHSLASLEQSMMELDHMADHFQRPHHGHHGHHGHHHHHDENDDFFSDLPVRRRDQPAPNAEEQHTDHQQQGDGTKRTFSTYSFSNSTVLDDKGQRVTTTRRRYEDSTGRLKAVHEREIGDKKLRSVWNKKDKDDDGSHEKTLTGGGDVEEFEAAWKQTAFGQAEDKQQQTLQHKEQAPAIDQ